MNSFALMLFIFSLLSFGFADGFIDFGFGEYKAVAVEGQLFCGVLPLSGAKVILYEYNDPGANSRLSTSKAGHSGDFYVEGGEHELFGHDFRLKIFYECAGLSQCHEFRIPEKFYSRFAERPYDLGEIRLERLEPNCDQRAPHRLIEFFRR